MEGSRGGARRAQLRLMAARGVSGASWALSWAVLGAQDGPRGAQDGSKRVPERSKRAYERPRRPKRLQDAPGGAQEVSQERPKRSKSLIFIAGKRTF
eukprot:1256420-Pyramimonas_sp.AAC.1